MPFVHISLRAGKPEAYRQAIFDGLYRALRETFNVPEDDQFMTISEHDAANFRYGASYLDIARSDDLVFIQITANNTRESPGLRPEDVFVNLVEVTKENWSFGHGLAQYA
jgi:4-oxalocrotonate tautomerase